MKPEGRKQQLELALNGLMIDYEQETGLRIDAFQFSRRLTSEVGKTYVPQVQLEVRVPD